MYLQCSYNLAYKTQTNFTVLISGLLLCRWYSLKQIRDRVQMAKITFPTEQWVRTCCWTVPMLSSKAQSRNLLPPVCLMTGFKALFLPGCPSNPFNPGSPWAPLGPSVHLPGGPFSPGGPGFPGSPAKQSPGIYSTKPEVLVLLSQSFSCNFPP